MDELGIPGIEIESWYGMWEPANMRHEVVNVLNREIAEAVTAPRVVDCLISQGAHSNRLECGRFRSLDESGELTRI
jgi:tripartite-type tricarboxylate transporter receptor subunit TctC